MKNNISPGALCDPSVSEAITTPQTRFSPIVRTADSLSQGIQKSHIGKRFGAVFFATMFSMGALQGAAHADNFAWQGTTDNDWNTGGNWVKTAGTSLRDFPNDGTDIATFSNVSTANKSPNISASVTVNNVTATTTGYTISSSSGQTLTLGGTAPAVSVGASAATQLTISATLAGTGFTKSSPGTVILSGTNTFTAASTLAFAAGGNIDAGAIRLASNGALGGVTTISEPATGIAVNRVELSGGITVGSGININAGGRTTARSTGAALLNLSGDNTWAGNVRATGPGGNVGVRSASGTLLTLSGTLSATITGRTLDVGDAGDILVTGAFANAGAAGAVNYNKYGAGKLTYAGTNTYTGTTTIEAGTLQVGNGGTTGVITNNTPLGSVVNNASLVFNRSNGFTVGNLISGTGTVTQAGTGATSLSNANTYTGATNVQAGTLNLNRTTQTAIVAASAVTVADGATLQITNHAGGNQQPYANAITLNGAGAGGAGALSFLNSGAFAMSGPINLASNTVIRTDASGQNVNSLISFTDVISGAADLTLLAVGTNADGTPQFALTGANTYSGTTLITSDSAATTPFQVILDGSLVSATTVAANTRLSGSGTISNTVAIASGATHAPGSPNGGTGIENVGAYSNAGTLAVDLAGATAGTNYDQVNVTGTVTLGGQLQVTLPPTFTPTVGNAFTIVNNDGTDAVISTFNGVAEGGSVSSTNGRATFTVSYVGGDGNDVTLTVSSVVANTAPNFPAASYTAGLNDPLNIQLTATDADGDTLTYTSANVPAGLSLSATGLLTGTPAAAGNFLFQVTVDDGKGGTATANIFIAVRDVPAGTDTLGPVLTHNALPKTLTRDELADFTVTGTVRDVAPGAITPAGVRRVLVNLRTGDNQQAYNGSEFTTNLNRGYYIATQSAGTGNTSETLTYSRSLAFVPTNLPAGAYILVLYPQDVLGNYSAEFLQFTVTAPAAATKSPDVNSGGAS